MEDIDKPELTPDERLEKLRRYYEKEYQKLINERQEENKQDNI